MIHREEDLADDVLEDEDEERDGRREIGVHRGDVDAGSRAGAEEQIPRLRASVRAECVWKPKQLGATCAGDVRQ